MLSSTHWDMFQCAVGSPEWSHIPIEIQVKLTFGSIGLFWLIFELCLWVGTYRYVVKYKLQMKPYDKLSFEDSTRKWYALYLRKQGQYALADWILYNSYKQITYQQFLKEREAKLKAIESTKTSTK